MRFAERLRSVGFVAKTRVRVLLGRPVRIRTADRRLLEETIIPHYVRRADVQRILFVGCAPYTAHYPDLWPGKEFWTIDVDPRRRRYGSARHVVDSVENLSRHFDEGSFDLVICSGVYGHGIDTKAACERALDACFTVLREGGEFLFGWNQLPRYAPVPLDRIEALARFRRTAFPLFGCWRHVCETDLRHTYDFYVKPVPCGAPAGPGLPGLFMRHRSEKPEMLERSGTRSDSGTKAYSTVRRGHESRGRPRFPVDPASQ